jgi:hypothetical protein
MEKLFYPLDVYMNVVLVNNDVRPAMLVQPQDYYNGPDDQFSTILNSIKTLFPKLILTDTYDTYQGVIVSKKDYTGRKDISGEEMGIILGYPCAEDTYSNFNEDRTKYYFSVNAIVDDGGEEGSVQLIPNVCEGSSKRSQFESIAKDAKKVFESLGLTFVKDVVVKLRAKIPMKVLVRKLKKNETLLEEDIYELNEMLENFDFKDLLMKDFDVSNPIHRGILIGLLFHYKNDPLSAFFPIQNFPVEHKIVNGITRSWERSIGFFVNKKFLSSRKKKH